MQLPSSYTSCDAASLSAINPFGVHTLWREGQTGSATLPGMCKVSLEAIHILYSEGGGMTQPGRVVRPSVAFSGKQ